MTQPPYEPQQPYYPQQQPYPPPPVRPVGVVAAKNPAVALILGLIWPGLGHLYAGKVGGLLLMLLVWPFVAALPWIAAATGSNPAILVCVVLSILGWILIASSGYSAAEKFNRRNGIEVR